MKLSELKIGDVLIKGNRERLFRGCDAFMVAYQTKTDIRNKRITGIPIADFEAWLKGAELKERREEFA